MTAFFTTLAVLVTASSRSSAHARMDTRRGVGVRTRLVGFLAGGCRQVDVAAGPLAARHHGRMALSRDLHQLLRFDPTLRHDRARDDGVLRAAGLSDRASVPRARSLELCWRQLVEQKTRLVVARLLRRSYHSTTVGPRTVGSRRSCHFQRSWIASRYSHYRRASSSTALSLAGVSAQIRRSRPQGSAAAASSAPAGRENRCWRSKGRLHDKRSEIRGEGQRDLDLDGPGGHLLKPGGSSDRRLHRVGDVHRAGAHVGERPCASLWRVIGGNNSTPITQRFLYCAAYGTATTSSAGSDPRRSRRRRPAAGGERGHQESRKGAAGDAGRSRCR